MTEQPSRHAQLWMRRARRDLEAIERLEATYLADRQPAPADAALAIYLLQQFTEKSVKALLVANGVDPDADRSSFRVHESMSLFLQLIRRTLDQPRIRDAIADLDGTATASSPTFGKIFKKLESLEALPKSRWQGLDSDQVSSFLDAVEDMRQFGTQYLESDVRSAFRAEVPDSLIASGRPIHEVLGLDPTLKLPPRADPTDLQRSAMAGIVLGIMSDGGSQEFRRLIKISGGAVEFDVGVFSSAFEEITALFTVFALAAITAPHNDSSRYPASADGPDDPVEAAVAGRLGTQHYRPPLGIVVHLKRLIEEARYIASTFGENAFRD